jgi:membrane protease YdiL (CAAX protease family)
MRKTLRRLLVARPAWFFGLIWLASDLYLFLNGQAGLALNGLFLLVGVIVLGFFTLRLSDPAPRSKTPNNQRAWLEFALQLFVILLFIVLTAYRGLVFHSVLAEFPGLPLWTPLLQRLDVIGGEWLGNPNYLVNPLLYLVIPFVLLVLLGAHPTGLGFGRGHQVWRITFLWAIPPLLVILGTLITGQVSLNRLSLRLLSNSLQHGFFEEFLFRGALQTRLRKVWSPGWALVSQAMLFGIWHLGVGYSTTGGGFGQALASTLVNQAVLGLAFGLIFERSRNLFASSVVHVLLNSMGI